MAGWRLRRWANLGILINGVVAGDTLFTVMRRWMLSSSSRPIRQDTGWISDSSGHLERTDEIYTALLGACQSTLESRSGKLRAFLHTDHTAKTTSRNARNIVLGLDHVSISPSLYCLGTSVYTQPPDIGHLSVLFGNRHHKTVYSTLEHLPSTDNNKGDSI